VAFGEGHHLRHWARGGPTTLSNLTLLCRRHHRAVHEEGYRVCRASDGTLRFTRPDGRPIPEVPCALSVPVDSSAVLRAQDGCPPITARTGMPVWSGERLDVSWALDVLRPPANPVEAPRLAFE
jgi:hypothetical protein